MSKAHGNSNGLPYHTIPTDSARLNTRPSRFHHIIEKKSTRYYPWLSIDSRRIFHFGATYLNMLYWPANHSAAGCQLTHRHGSQHGWHCTPHGPVNTFNWTRRTNGIALGIYDNTIQNKISILFWWMFFFSSFFPPFSFSIRTAFAACSSIPLLSWLGNIQANMIGVHFQKCPLRPREAIKNEYAAFTHMSSHPSRRCALERSILMCQWRGANQDGSRWLNMALADPAFLPEEMSERHAWHGWRLHQWGQDWTGKADGFPIW